MTTPLAIMRIMEGRIQQIERAQRQQAGNPIADRQKYWFRASPSCPPSTIVNVRGGILYESPDGPGAGGAIDIPALECDFGVGGTDGGAGAFTTAYAYCGYVMVLYATVAGVPGLSFWYDTSEYATAAEAEVAVWPNVMDTAGPFLDGLPLCILILKNNGVTGVDGQIEPIDAVNRGRSYIMRDVRPRYFVSLAFT